MPIITGGGGSGSPIGAAGGDLAGTYPSPTVTGPTHIPAASIAISQLADPTTGLVIGSVTNAAAAVRPPGFVWSYTQITSNANITDLAEATATALISPAAFTPDGAAVLATFFSPALTTPQTATSFMVVSLFEGATQIGRFGNWSTGTTTNVSLTPAATCHLRFTPTNASHTYKVTAFVSSTTGTPNIGAGALGTAAYPPAFVMFQKV